ncbi:response regulator receiver and unknown domain protein [Desulfovibrio sp. X2]|uniref:response regulator n=1 Tax=Desulfovibrio sp. X2 TaxID=941449 RepID=UPI000358DF6C|nr:response regulator [Desulfovibrio sp. X2]EPR37687.1 response regulator receiver and unknown domain protein [Desulfovibrio sp. X2]
MTTRVLIVEDDERIAELHRRFTARVPGCEVLGIAHSLEDARDMARALKPHLVLLDLYFPEGSGMDFLRELRLEGLEIDVILITAAREMEPLKEALRGGVFDYLIKPVTAERFHDCLHKFHAYRRRLRDGSAIQQHDVDSLLHPAATRPLVGSGSLPKGIDTLTLGKVRGVFSADSGPVGRSADEVAVLIGVSRSTARRYLEFLISDGSLYADLVYGNVGRPERRYFRA